MKAEEIVQEILSECPGSTHKEIMNAIELKKTQSNGYLTTEAAARLVAVELGLKNRPSVFSSSININQLIAGFNDVTITGRVLLTKPPKTFSKPQGKGKVARLLIGDNTGTIKVVMWDKKADLAEKIQFGQILKVEHGYIRLSWQGETELHVGERTNVVIAPPITEGNLPLPSEFMQTIEEVEESQRRVNLKGTVKGKRPINIFKRRDETEGRVLKMVLEDETGEIPVAFWNQKAIEASKIEKGTRIMLINARVKKHAGLLELQVGEDSHVEAQESS
ncbi:hypothetical protein KAU25_01830 [Candidatus Bathyarchaeota archaeon]|nr:hypothetical protein [Candidatus Bathyarchaeota archaeon]